MLEWVEFPVTGNTTMIDYDTLLNNRHKWYLKWDEPYPAISKDGNSVDAHVTLCASIHDCINMSRLSAQSHITYANEISDKDLLIHFISINWATVVPEDKIC